MENLVSLGLLIVLQAVLGFDNLLYVTLEAKNAPPDKQAMVRAMGIGLAVVLRIVLLFLLMNMIRHFQNPMFGINVGNIIHSQFNLHSVIVLLGGAFIIYTATKEILHMMNLEEHDHAQAKKRSLRSVVFWIVMMNLVFSFDSILSAMALSDVFWVMASSILIGGALMIWLSGRVAVFLQKNRMYEVLGLFILFVVGIMLLTEGGHLAHLELFGRGITPMSKTTFYFVIVVLLITEIAQSRYKRKLIGQKS